MGWLPVHLLVYRQVLGGCKLLFLKIALKILLVLPLSQVVGDLPDLGHVVRVGSRLVPAY